MGCFNEVRKKQKRLFPKDFNTKVLNDGVTNSKLKRSATMIEELG